ncbi:DUF2695 domain-containing protein [Paenarthrobacter sp. Z7-10]|uniref:DUF2695 domain-containing protein n=1 Tax=Paenarthrobacter sp. Z7-10 TaxID=2787635 RepID=UPI003FA7E528
MRLSSILLTAAWPGECLVCYVMRMLEFGCRGLGWTTRYRDEHAPHATALARRLGAMGAYCDCEIFLNAYEPNPVHFAQDEFGDVIEQPMPVCRGVRKNSVQPCGLWLRMRRY